VLGIEPRAFSMLNSTTELYSKPSDDDSELCCKREQRNGVESIQQYGVKKTKFCYGGK
jgi:hypothetical protein